MRHYSAPMSLSARVASRATAPGVRVEGGSTPADAPAVRSPLRAAVAGSMAGKAVEMVTLVLLATVVPRVLGPVAYGRFAVPLTIVTVGSLALTLGGPAVMNRYVPAAPPADRVGLARALGARLARGRAVQLVAMGAVTALVVALRPDILPPLVTALVALALVLNVAASLVMQMGLGLGRTGAWSARFPLQNAVLVVAVLGLDGVAGPTGAVVALVVAGVAACALAAATVGPALRGDHSLVAVPDGAQRFGTVQATAAALVQATQRGGVLAVALLAGSAVQTGYASLAIGIALGATYAVLQAFTVCLPHLGGLPDARGAAVSGRPALGPLPSGAPTPDHAAPGAPAPGAEAALRRLAGALLAVIVPAAVLGALLIEVIVPAAFGTGYEGAARAFGPALAVVTLAPLHSLAVQGSVLRLRPEAALAGGVAAAAAFVVAAVIAVPAWGATGGLVAVLAAAAVGLVASLALLPGLAGRALPSATAAGATAVLLAALAVT